MTVASRSFRRLMRNSGWNMVGQGAGLVVALLAIPLLIRHLGQTGFGIFSVCLALIGYSGILDLGIGRAITAKVARFQADGDREGSVATGSSAILILTVAGVMLFALTFVGARAIANVVFGEESAIHAHGIHSIRLLAVAAPIALLTSGIRGVLEGIQEFKAIALVNVPSGVLMFAAPTAVSFFAPQAHYAVAALVAVRLATLIGLSALCIRRMDVFATNSVSRTHIAGLLTAGGWVSVSNIVSPLMTNLDRIFVSAQISPAAASLHVTGFELANKALLPAGSIANAAYPVFASWGGGAGGWGVRRYFTRIFLLTALTSLIPAAFLFVFAHDILSTWISPEFANGTAIGILKTFAIGIAVNGAAYIPFAYVQGIGRADMAAKFHMFELVVYLPSLIYSIDVYGVAGAAYVWVGRVALDGILLTAFALKNLPSE